MRAREGDLIETRDGVIFDVKGLVHPTGKVIAFPRFIPSLDGTRRRRGSLYGKVYSLSDRFRFLKEKLPELIVHDPVFDEVLCEVPINNIRKHYLPTEKLAELRLAKRLGALERKAAELVETLKKAAGIPWSSLGISGSIMVGMHTVKSDIDPVVYGVENCRRAYATLESLLKDGRSKFKRYSREELQALFDFRSKDTIMTFEDFAEVESRKAFQGKFRETDYFVRFVKDWSQVKEKYGDVRYKNCGYAKITATVADYSEGLFTPCTYRVEDCKVIDGLEVEPILEIVSFRGRFCEQAIIGERVVAQGKVERVTDAKQSREYYRMILGNKPTDFMAMLHI
jgi:predicted nucleotidyltransferase